MRCPEGIDQLTIRDRRQPAIQCVGPIRHEATDVPKRGDKPEWQHTQDYWAEKDELPSADLDDGCLVYE